MTAPSEFDYGKEPYWSDLTPHPACNVTREQYPDPRPCAYGYDARICHLGHPANCRWLVDCDMHETALAASSEVAKREPVQR
jgi:hypothetical protein